MKVVIVDGSEIFISNDYYRKHEGKTLVRMISEMKRAILLTSKKMMKRPKDLYYLMRMVRPDLIPGFYEFGYRYCDPR